MVKKHGRIRPIQVFEADDLVSFKIPRMDRSATDNLRVVCRVLAQTRLNRYQLISEHAIPNRDFRVNELLRVFMSARPGQPRSGDPRHCSWSTFNHHARSC